MDVPSATSGSEAAGTGRASPRRRATTGMDVVVVVHGMGDQTKFASLQAVVQQICRIRAVPQGHSLGALHSALQPDAGDLADGKVPREHGWAELDGLERLGFAEVFWADIGRAHEAYVLEDTVAWSKSIVGRLKMVEEEVAAALREPAPSTHTKLNLALIRRVLSDIGLGIRLMRLANRLLTKLGLGSLPLDALLVRFLGDVQLYADYKRPRESVMKRFHAQLDAIQERATAWEADNEGEVSLHFVAHSWGSAVAFVGLLEGRREQADRPWIHRVETFMTFGSPIDKLLILWPALADELRDPTPPEEPQDIRWFNYADRGDPIGYELDTAREFVAAEVPGLFDVDFAAQHDHVFRRYMVPGKAHVDYWDDDPLFDQWFGAGVEQGAHPAPRNRPVAGLVSHVLLFAVPAAFAAIAAYFIVQAMNTLFETDLESDTVLAAAAMLVGLIVFGRSCRVTRHAWIRVGVGLTLAVVGFLYLRTQADHAAVYVCSGYAFLLAVATVAMDLFWPRLSTVSGRLWTWAALVLPALGTYFITYFVLRRSDGGEALMGGVVQLAAGLLAFALAVLFWDLASVWWYYVRDGRHVRFLRRHFRVGASAPAATPPASEAESSSGAAPGAAPASARHAPAGYEKGAPPWWLRR